MRSNTLSLLKNAVMTGTSEVDSSPITIDQIFGYAVQAIWTGTPNGTMLLQASCDAPARETQTSNGGPDVVTNWSDITGTSITIAGSSGNFMWNLDGTFYRYFRLKYVNTSGTGSLTVNAVLKGV